MGLEALRRQMTLAVALVLMGASTLPADACGRSCGSEAPSYGRAFRSYGYQAYLPRRPAPRPLSRAQVLNTPPVPGGSTTLDPPGLMTTQGILESPVPGPGPSLIGPGGSQYGYSGRALPAPRSRRWRR
jgi:hypothetical protein